MHPITPHRIWIGHAGDGGDYRQLFDNDIRALVHLAAEEPPAAVPRDLVYLRIPLLDGAENPPSLLRLAVKSVASLIQLQIPTLVTCGGGMSRSPAIVAAALTLSFHMTLAEALATVTRAHHADISPALWAEIERLKPDGSYW